MAHVVKDRVKESSTTTGTGNITLAGAVTGFITFASRLANNDTCYYCIEHQSANEWEVGKGTWQTGGTLVRSTVYASTNADAAVSFSSGTKHVFLTQPANAYTTIDALAVMTDPDYSLDKVAVFDKSANTTDAMTLSALILPMVTARSMGLIGN